MFITVAVSRVISTVERYQLSSTACILIKASLHFGITSGKTARKDASFLLVAVCGVSSSFIAFIYI